MAEKQGCTRGCEEKASGVGALSQGRHVLDHEWLLSRAYRCLSSLYCSNMLCMVCMLAAQSQ
jgi:hypothetical protein